jgi:glycosyltransferase involved in cell wall biosynthesis
MTESWDPRGVRGSARRVRYTWRTAQWRRHIDSILAMGDLAAKQFITAGIPAERVIPFSYSVSNCDGEVATDTQHTPKIVFVSGLEARKDPLLLVDAVSSLRNTQLTLVGAGSLETDVRRRISRKGLVDRVQVIERLENTAVRELLARANLLVL